MPVDYIAEKRELNETHYIEKLSESLKKSAFKILLKIRERQPITAMSLLNEVKMESHRYNDIKKWLETNEYIKSRTSKQKRSKKEFLITPKGEGSLLRREHVGVLKEWASYLAGSTTFSQEMEGFSHLISEAFTMVYDKLYLLGDTKHYLQFLQAIEGLTHEHLNKNISKDFEKIKKGINAGYYRDPYFLIDWIHLHAVYYDAKLAKRMDHFLTANHRYILIKSKEFVEEELIEHNREWVRRFEEEEIEGENEPNAQLWRLSPNLLIEREMEIREKIVLPEKLQDYPNQTYGMKFQEYYNKLRVQRYSHNGFQTDEKWPIDIHKTQENYEKRKKAREIETLGIDIETIIKTHPSEKMKQYKKMIDGDTTFSNH